MDRHWKMEAWRWVARRHAARGGVVKATQLAGAKMNSVHPSLAQLFDDVVDRGRERAELHVDVLDAGARDRSRWLSSACDHFKALCRHCEQRGHPCTAALQLYLTSGNPRLGGAFTSWSELSDQLSWTPPSIIVYRSGQEPWVENSSFVQLTPERFPDRPADSRVLFQEWFDDAEQDFDRRVWVVLEGMPEPNS